MGGDCPAVVEELWEAFAYSRPEDILWVHQGGWGEGHHMELVVTQHDVLHIPLHRSLVRVVHLVYLTIVRVNGGVVSIGFADNTDYAGAPVVVSLKLVENEVCP